MCGIVNSFYTIGNIIYIVLWIKIILTHYFAVSTRIVVAPKDQAGLLHETVALQCNASGNPLPSISWYKNDKEVTTT